MNPPHLHHLALGARDVSTVAAFYRDVLKLTEIKRHRYPDGSLRSVWLRLGPSILMIEHGQTTRRRVDQVGAGPFLLALRIGEDERDEWERRLHDAGAPIEDRTAYTSYFRDPEDNRVAVSHYPIPEPER